MTLTMHVGWNELHPDASLNFQLNRWNAYGGSRWFEDVRPVLSRLTSYEAWKDTFVSLGEMALSEGRPFHAALHFRSAEFFMTTDDPRKQPLRARLLPLLRAESGVPETARRWVPFDGAQLPAWHLVPPRSKGTFVVFGGFDSYIEEFFPFLTQMRDDGWTIVAFEGPGQGTALEESKTVLTPDWHRPVAAVLNAFGLNDVTLLGISLGGCLVMRAAALEPRVSRVIAWDIMTDFYACMTLNLPPSLLNLANEAGNEEAKSRFDLAIRNAATKSPMLDWAMNQALHVLGCKSPNEVFTRACDFHTRDISNRIRQDVLLMAGAQDHYVPLDQAFEQARLLSAARSTTIRIFTRDEYAQMHCQLGNFPLAIRVMEDWAEERARAPRAVG
jgi:pimeloyl-ACP methyl ester carboxylesterase